MLTLRKQLNIKTKQEAVTNYFVQYHTAWYKTMRISHNFLSIYLTQAASGKEVIICENFSMK